MKISELKEGYHMFGNKGNVFSNNAHIAKSGFDSTSLCGTPMISNNWAKISKLGEANCKECNKIYNEQIKK